MAKPKPTKMLAVLGHCHRTGRWRLASRSAVVAVLGTCHLDMRDSFVEAEQLRMKVTVVLGSATFIVPNGAEVKPSGMSLLGGSMVDVPEHEDTADLPTLQIEWISIFGRVRIVTEETMAVDPADGHTDGAVIDRGTGDTAIDGATRADPGAGQRVSADRGAPAPAARP